MKRIYTCVEISEPNQNCCVYKSLWLGLKWDKSRKSTIQWAEIKTRTMQHGGHHSLPWGKHNITFTQFVLSFYLLCYCDIWFKAVREKSWSQKIQRMMFAKWKCHCPILLFLFLCSCLHFCHCQMTKSGQDMSSNTYRILHLLGFFSQSRETSISTKYYALIRQVNYSLQFDVW